MKRCLADSAVVIGPERIEIIMAQIWMEAMYFVPTPYLRILEVDTGILCTFEMKLVISIGSVRSRPDSIKYTAS